MFRSACLKTCIWPIVCHCKQDVFILCTQVTDGIFQRLEKTVIMVGRGMSVDQAKDAILSDVETNFVAAGLLDDTPQQKPGLRVIHDICCVMMPVIVVLLLASHTKGAC